MEHLLTHAENLDSSAVQVSDIVVSSQLPDGVTSIVVDSVEGLSIDTSVAVVNVTITFDDANLPAVHAKLELDGFNFVAPTTDAELTTLFDSLETALDAQLPSHTGTIIEFVTVADSELSQFPDWGSNDDRTITHKGGFYQTANGRLAEDADGTRFLMVYDPSTTVYHYFTELGDAEGHFNDGYGSTLSKVSSGWVSSVVDETTSVLGRVLNGKTSQSKMHQLQRQMQQQLTNKLFSKISFGIFFLLSKTV